MIAFLPLPRLEQSLIFPWPSSPILFIDLNNIIDAALPERDRVLLEVLRLLLRVPPRGPSQGHLQEDPDQGQAPLRARVARPRRPAVPWMAALRNTPARAPHPPLPQGHRHRPRDRTASQWIQSSPRPLLIRPHFNCARTHYHPAPSLALPKQRRPSLTKWWKGRSPVETGCCVGCAAKKRGRGGFLEVFIG